MIRVFTLLTILFCLHISLTAQFPTAIGTKWEYFQFFEDQVHPMAVWNAFQDEVTADTTVLGTTYHKVTRTGRMYYGGWLYSRYDTVDATYFYRVAGTQVRVLDSADGSQTYESLLYEFGLNLGDTLNEIPKNLISLSPVAKDSIYLKYYDFDSLCMGFPCDSNFILVNQLASPPTIPTALKWDPHGNIIFIEDIGTVYSHPYMIALDVYGQYYYLGTLTSGGNTLYTNPFIASMAVEPPAGIAFSIYPNPTHDRVNIECGKAIHAVHLYDLLGNELMRKEIAPTLETSLTLPELPSGMYFLQVEGEGWKMSRHLQVH